MREDRLDDATLDVCEHGRPNHQDLIRQLLEALGKGTHARAQTPQAVFEECLTECRRLRATETAARALLDALDESLPGDVAEPGGYIRSYCDDEIEALRAALSAASTEPPECDIGGGTCDCRHVCCDEPSNPFHDHFLPAEQCPSCERVREMWRQEGHTGEGR